MAAATTLSAYFTVVAGLLAVIGAAAVLYAARIARQTERESSDRRNDDLVRRTAASYVGEISSLETYLKEKKIVDELRSNAENRCRFYFQPGDNWLNGYFQDPISVGVFDPDLSTEIIAFYCKMRNELGRLKWMHRLTQDDIQRMTEAELFRQMEHSSESLSRLLTECQGLKPKLVRFARSTR